MLTGELPPEPILVGEVKLPVLSDSCAVNTLPELNVPCVKLILPEAGVLQSTVNGAPVTVGAPIVCAVVETIFTFELLLVQVAV